MQALAMAAKQQNLKTLRLVGHAAPHEAYGKETELSKRRVEAVRDALLRLGVQARIKISWRGARAPFDTSALPIQPQTDAERQALDRRIDWLRGKGE